MAPISGRKRLILLPMLSDMMRPLRALAAFLIIAGAALTIYGVAAGEMQVALIIFVPVITGSSIVGILAIGSIIVGVLIAMADAFLGAGTESPQEAVPAEGQAKERAKTEFGGVMLIGPIPIVFGSSNRAALYALLIAFVILVLFVLALFLGG